MSELNVSIEAHMEKKEYSTPIGTLFQKAAAQTGRKPFDMFREYFKLYRSAGKLTIQEYFLYRLYDDQLYGPEEKGLFLSESIHWPMTNSCSDVTWRGATEDKWLAYRILENAGYIVPKTQAVVDSSIRVFGDSLKVDTVSELKAFLSEKARYPIFAKPNRAMCSFGAFMIDKFEDGKALIDHEHWIGVEELRDKIIGDKPYLLQDCATNHPEIAAFSSGLATVRTVNMVSAKRVITPFTVMKIPTGTNIADNYWRSGNLIADIDPKSGEIRRVVSGKGPDIKEHTHSPDTGEELVGKQMPGWAELLNVNESCARHFAPVRYQSLDIALTADGPMVVEINSGGAFDLPQLASGKGMLTDEVMGFFEECGWAFKKRRFGERAERDRRPLEPELSGA